MLWFHSDAVTECPGCALWGLTSGPLKRLCETELGLVTQCCLVETLKREPPLYFTNLAQKINAKVASPAFLCRSTPGMGAGVIKDLSKQMGNPA